MEQKFKKKIIAILGPTGIGKTDLAIKLAKSFKLNIISADAFQVYKEMNIGTNKPKEEDIENLNYYGINLVDVDHNYSIYEFQNYVRNIIDNSDQTSIIVGGSMLYLDSVIYNYSLRPDFDNSNKYEELSDEELYKRLQALDPIAAKTIQIQNRKRIITALNYFLQFNESIRNNNQKYTNYYDVFFIYLKPYNKLVLNENNKKRVIRMLEDGWINEVSSILKKYPSFLKYNSSKAIGYSEIASSIINKNELNIQRIIIRTNQFVKHQLAWYKKYENKFNIISNSVNLSEDSLQKIKEFLK